MDYQSQTVTKVLKELKTNALGLRTAEARKRLVQYGLNQLKESEKRSKLSIFASQFKNFLVWVLIVAVAISLFLGDYFESAVILIIILINAIIGFIQEYRAEKAIDALKKLSGLKAEVIRNGERTTLDSRQLVPGDVLALEVGQKVPADARVIESFNMDAQEASLTGESTPVGKSTGPVATKTVAEQVNMVFSGTTITQGRGKAVVVRTGMKTEIGRIATLISEAPENLTPLQIKLERFAKNLGYGIIGVSIIVFVATLLQSDAALNSEYILSMFETAVSLAVAAIPEGLPAIVALSLALGIQRMIKRNALIRKLPSVETLGSTTVICSDKTGTLTKDQMTVRRIFVNGKVVEVSGKGYSTTGEFSVSKNGELDLLLKAGALCNDAELKKNETIHGDPTEAALLVSAAKGKIHYALLNRRAKRVDEIPFDSDRKRMSTIHIENRVKTMYTKGAPDVILGLCDHVQIDGKIMRLTPALKKGILVQNEKFAQQALRVLGFAYKNEKAEKPTERNLTFIGLQAMIDPPRDEAQRAIEQCHAAGIKVVMITGDHKLTAQAIAKELGILGKAVTGADLDRIKNLEDQVEDIAVYARVSPEHKMRIVKALKKRNHIVAMTGDGVNDAPALKQSDIGIAMGKTGTDVSREASNMILTDDNFASIVHAVEEGRSIFDNIKKFIYFLLSSNTAEVMVIFLAIVFGLPLPLVAIQILWMNLLTDGLPALALGIEPKDKDIMKRKPRLKMDNVVSRYTLIRLILMGAIMTAGCLGIFIWALQAVGWTAGDVLLGDDPGYMYAITMTFTALVMFELFNALNAKSETRSVLSSGLFKNTWLLAAILSSFLLQLLVLYSPLGSAFHTVPLSWADWGIILGMSSTILVADMLFKFFAGEKHAA